MGSLLEFRRPNRSPQRAVYGLGMRLVERDSSCGRRAILEIDGLAIFCVVADTPAVGDLIYGDVTAIVDKVRVTRDGHVHVYAHGSSAPAECVPLAGGGVQRAAASSSVHVDVLQRRLRRRRRSHDAPPKGPTNGLPYGA